MSIIFEKENKIFYLQTKSTSYIMQIFKEKYVCHLYWGRKLERVNSHNYLSVKNRCCASNPDSADKTYTLDCLPQEYPTVGAADYKKVALEVTYADGSILTELLYESYEIVQGKQKLQGLPATYVEQEEEAQTLIIYCREPRKNIRVALSYSVYEEYDAITRSVRIINESREEIVLDKAYSSSVDFLHNRLDMITFNGAWGRERYPERVGIRKGVQTIGSLRGASSHQSNPFYVLAAPNTTEDTGDAYGFNFVYSGNFIGGVEVDQNDYTRAFMGIHEDLFSWRLEPGETFQTPEVVLVYSHEGIGGMSRIFHKLYRERLCRGRYRDAERPVLINNWEATYFDFSHEKIMEITREARALGIELMVLDDGWFGKRNNDRSSLGDWYPNLEKLPAGIVGLAKDIHKEGLKFGLWFEPEMVSKDSELYREHPDWCIQAPGREPMESRHQMVLDMSREDVREYVYTAVSSTIEAAQIDYIKWDMNRHMTEYFSWKLDKNRQKELCHRYMLGLYEVLEKLTDKFPNVLFESCSSGGGRYDPGMLYYMPQTWTSDNTDAVERVYIQHGTSYVYPCCTMGAHVSAVPNHQVHRVTPLSIRGDVSMCGNFGYEMDITRFTEQEKVLVKEQVKNYKELRTWLPAADMFRLKDPFAGNTASWEFVDELQNNVCLFFFRILEKADMPDERLFLKGLDESATYECVQTGEQYLGAELMYGGYRVEYSHDNLCGDYASKMWIFKRI